MSNLFDILAGYMLHCGINEWGVSMEMKEAPDKRYLAKTAAYSPFISIAYVKIKILGFTHSIVLDERI